MAINKIISTARARAAIAAVLLMFAAGSYGVYDRQTDTAKVEGVAVPPAVILATEKLIKPWESVELIAYLDKLANPPVWTICWGDTLGVFKGMRKSQEECDRLLIQRVMRDFYGPLSKVPNFTQAPVSVQASMISGAYNFGVGSTSPRKGWLGSTARRMIEQRKWREACEAQTAWNKAGGKVLRGLVNRREMGDAQRLGEAELCVSGIPR